MHGIRDEQGCPLENGFQNAAFVGYLLVSLMRRMCRIPAENDQGVRNAKRSQREVGAL